MRLYHYSVDSYCGDSSLINDFANHFQFAEPFLLALNEGMDVFKACYFSCMYLSREMQDLKLRKRENFRKDAVEAIFEFVRRKEFADDSCSRLCCVYYCDSKEEAISYAMEDCINCGDFTKEQVKLLEVEVDEKHVYRYDQMLYNKACKYMKENQFSEVFAMARKYFAKERSNEPIIEILCDGENKVIKVLNY